MNNSRFSITLHILTLLAKAGGELLSSDYMAGSININPVLVRKELISLRKQGLVSSKEGKNGGYSLSKPVADIKLSDVYLTVQEFSLLSKSKNKPNPYCAVGKHINTHLDNLYQDAEKAILARLDKVTLKKFVHQFS
jgi:Rrf2 family protein